MGLVLFDFAEYAYSGIVENIKQTENHFLTGLYYIMLWGGIIALAFLFVFSFILVWQVPVGIVAFWLLCEGIYAFGKRLKGGK